MPGPEKQDTCVCGPRMERFIQPCLLLLLYEKEAHGYELSENLVHFGFEKELDPGMVYRNLRKLEEEDAVSSNWDTGGPGPARRVYTLTPHGKELIHEWACHIENKLQRLQFFLKRYHSNFSKGSEHGV
jgi:PadR family transcriptional regulator, regulatory protein PadR